MSNKVKKIFNIYGFTGGSFAGNVYDTNGIAPSINTCEGGNREPLILISEDEEKERLEDNSRQ